jgi:alpha-1,2-mannosyltransferase
MVLSDNRSRTPDAAPARRARAAAPAVGVVAVVAVLAAVAYLVQGRDDWGVDFSVYRQAATAVVHGRSPYGPLDNPYMLFVYTPFAALLVTPLAWLGASGALAVWTFLSLLALVAAVWLALGLVDPDAGGRRRGRLALAIAVAALLSGPILSDIWLGQINIIILAAVLWDLAGSPGRLRGVAIGIAAGIKLTPLIFVLYFLLTRQLRSAAVAGGTFLATMAVGFCLLPGPSRAYWGGLFLQPQRALPPGAILYNESLYGMFNRSPLDTSGLPWLEPAIAAVVGVCGLTVAVWAYRRGREQAGIIACAVTGLLCSPITWMAGWVWCVPILMLWGRRVLRGGVPLYEKVGIAVLALGCVVSTYWSVLLFYQNGHEPLAEQQISGNMYAVIGLGTLITLAVLLWRGDHRVPDPAPAAA